MHMCCCSQSIRVGIHYVDFASKMGSRSTDSQRNDDAVASRCIATAASGTRVEFEMRAESDVAAMQCCKGSEAASLAEEDEDEGDSETR